MQTRRDFLTNTVRVGAAALASGCATRGVAGDVDADLSVLCSDLHVGQLPEYDYTRARLVRFVDAVLAMSPRPKRVICFGDVALSYGLAADYAVSKPILQRLVDAGVELHMTMGNHDRRSAFLKYWPEYAENPLVAGRFTRVISLGTADLVLLDALRGADDRAEDDMGPVDGTLDPAQLAWFEGFVAHAQRPFLVGSHQYRDLRIEGARPIERAAQSRHFAGWIFGHDHEWCTALQTISWKGRCIRQAQALPSLGLWGDIGHVVMRTTATHAELTLQQEDFYFTKPRPASERPASWAARVEDNRGRRMRFIFDSVPATSSPRV